MLDHDGFLWVGTKSGVSRFDYHEFKNYSSVPDSAASLPGNLVHFIVEDARHNIWISTLTDIISFSLQNVGRSISPVRQSNSHNPFHLDDSTQ